MSAKAQRQAAITRLIEQSEVCSQARLVELLSAEGIRATQVTVSRDLEEIGAIKVRTGGGAAVYALPELAPDRVAPSDQLRRVLGEWVADVGCSGNIVVLRTPPGCAHVVGSALDRSRHEGIIGTVAGDDTVLCVSADPVGGEALAAQLRELAGIDGGGER